jgi:hypothetical protein
LRIQSFRLSTSRKKTSQTADNQFESPWQLFCYGQLKGLSDEEAVPALAAWCKRLGLEMSFVTRRVRHVDVLCVVLKVKPSKQ